MGDGGSDRRSLFMSELVWFFYVRRENKQNTNKSDGSTRKRSFFQNQTVDAMRRVKTSEPSEQFESSCCRMETRHEHTERQPKAPARVPPEPEPQLEGGLKLKSFI